MPSQLAEEGNLTTEPQEFDASDQHEQEATTTKPENDVTDSGKRWDAAIWAGEILSQHIIQSSWHNLDTNLKRFLQEASEDDRKAHEESRKKVLNIMKQVKEKHDARYPPGSPNSERRFVDSVKAACSTASETAYEYAKILDIMVSQAPEYVALAYGAIKIILVTHINYMNMKENVSTWMLKIKSNFEMIDHLTSYHPSKCLLDAIVRMFDAFQRFLAEALKFYTRSRLRHALTSLKKPWTALEPIVKSIEVTCAEIKDIVIFSTHFTGELNLRISQANLFTNQAMLAKLSHMMDWMEANVVKFANLHSVEETGGLLRQCTEAKMEQHSISDRPTPDEDQAVSDISRASPSLDDHLSAIFADLAEFDEAAAQQQKMTDQSPEMIAHQQTQQSILRVDKVMDWLESKTSKLLWVDGGHILDRLTFNASFVDPILIFGNNNFETGCLILRHFCGDASSLRPSNYRTLLQALLRQLLKTRKNIWTALAGEFTEENATDIRKLWGLFVACIKKAKADCTFIVVDSIDCLVSSHLDCGIEERDFIITELNELVKESNPLVKILLTKSLSEATTTLSSSSTLATMPSTREAISTALLAMSTPITRRPRRSLSMNIFQNNLALAPQKLLEIQEKRRTIVRFAELPMLYLVNSTIYTYEAGHHLAFVISEVSGMEPRHVGSYDTYEPLVLLVWAIDHNGETFIKRHYTFKIRQFAGEIRIDQLQYVPSGYLADEHSLRQQLIRRGRRYWELSSNDHFMQYLPSCHHRPEAPTASTKRSRRLDIRLSELHPSKVKPLFALVCPAQISGYSLHDNSWRQLDILDIQRPVFRKCALSRLILDDKSSLQAAIEQFRDFDYVPHDSTLVLLYGPPGVGKTTAARCSAEELQRPLLEISAGDIAKPGADMYEIFQQTLHQAECWRAVLLLENIDLLLMESTDKISNDNYNHILMVKSLEMHRGLVFLTTNRIGLLSTLIRYRITFPIELFPFDSKMRRQLWNELLIEYTEVCKRNGSRGIHSDLYARVMSGELSEGMNGWDITNTFKTAMKSLSKGEILSLHDLELSLKLQVDIRERIHQLRGLDEGKWAEKQGSRPKRHPQKEEATDRELYLK